jgi:hypothetical protein
MQAGCGTPVIPAFRRQRQEDPTFKTSLGYTARPYLKKKKQKHNCIDESLFKDKFIDECLFKGK